MPGDVARAAAYMSSTPPSRPGACARWSKCSKHGIVVATNDDFGELLIEALEEAVSYQQGSAPAFA